MNDDEYKIRKRVVEPSKPIYGPGGGRTKQRCVFDVLWRGRVVRTHESETVAQADVARRLQRKEVFTVVRDEIGDSGEAMVVKRQGRSPVTVRIDPELKKTAKTNSRASQPARKYTPDELEALEHEFFDKFGLAYDQLVLREQRYLDAGHSLYAAAVRHEREALPQEWLKSGAA